MMDDQKSLIIQGVIAGTFFVVFSIFHFYFKAEAEECLSKVPEFTHAEVTSIRRHGRHKDVSYTYFVDKKRYVSSIPFTDKLELNQIIRIVYCKSHHNHSMWYEDYIRMINSK